MCVLVAQATGADDLASIRSAPPDLTPYMRPAVPEDNAPFGKETGVLFGTLPPRFSNLQIVDVVVDNTDHTLVFTDQFNDGETSIAVNRQNPQEIIISAFSGRSGNDVPLWHSIDGGNTWTKEFSVPAAPGVPAIFGCGGPCDQTFDYGRNNRLSGAILSSVTTMAVLSETAIAPTM